MKSILTVLFVCLLGFVSAQDHYYVEIKTSAGVMIVKLHNETPKHRDNFKKLVDDGYYDSLLFHRVIRNFMIQGGDPTSKNAQYGTQLGDGGPEYKVPAEFDKGLFHAKGALGAAREGDNNPEKSSSASQFYLVQGRKFSAAGLDSLEVMRMKGVKFSEAQRNAYMTVGGTPHLDGSYTVFGQTIEGLEYIDAVAKVSTDERDRPIVDERMYMRMLNKKEAINLERKQKGLKPKKVIFKGSKSYKIK